MIGYLDVLHQKYEISATPIEYKEQPAAAKILNKKGMRLFDNEKYTAAKNLPKFAYHGTSRKQAERFLKNGVKGVSLTGNPDDAMYWAMQRMAQFNSDAVVLQIPTSALKPSLIEPNDDEGNELHIFYSGKIEPKNFKEYSFFTLKNNDAEARLLTKIMTILASAGFKSTPIKKNNPYYFVVDAPIILIKSVIDNHFELFPKKIKTSKGKITIYSYNKNNRENFSLRPHPNKMTEFYIDSMLTRD